MSVCTDTIYNVLDTKLHRIPLELEDGKDALAIISSWFFKEPTLEQERNSDVVVVDKFGLVELDFDRTEHVRVNVSNYDPYTHCLLIFYAVCPLRTAIYIHGIITWDKLHELGGGVVNIRNDTVFTRSYIPTFPLDAMDCDVEDGECVLSHVLPLKSLLDDSMLSHTTSYDCIVKRVDWILGTGEDNMLPIFSMQDELTSTLSMALIEACIEEGYSLPGTDIDMTRHHACFFELRMEKEHARFAQLFMRHCASENQTRLFVVANNFNVKTVSIVQATQLDRQRFYTVIDRTAPPITISFRVSFHTVPVQMAKTLAIYPGGFMHLSYADMFEWFWHQFYLQEQSVGIIKGMTNVDAFKQQAHKIVKHTIQGNKKLVPSTRKKWRNRNRNQDNDEQPGIVVEMDYLTSIVPKCIKMTMERKRFPRYREAKTLIAAFKKAGLKKELLFDWFEQMNAKYPEGHESTIARFRYDFWWDAITYITHCEWIIADTKAGGDETVKCPFVSDVVDIEDIKYGACAPNEPPFTGPHNLVKRYLYRRQVKEPVAIAVEEKSPPPPPQVFESEESSEEKSAIEEEEQVYKELGDDD